AMPAGSPSAGATAESTRTAPSASGLVQTAREHSALGAQAFVRHYIEVYNRALETGQTEDLAGLAGSACKTCAAYVKQVVDIYRGGGRIEGGEVSIANTAAPKLRPNLDVVVEARATISLERDFDRSGKLIDRFGADSAIMLFYPEWVVDKWLMHEIKAGVER